MFLSKITITTILSFAHLALGLKKTTRPIQEFTNELQKIVPPKLLWGSNEGKEILYRVSVSYIYFIMLRIFNR
jgi:hypothetical protein